MRSGNVRWMTRALGLGLVAVLVATASAGAASLSCPQGWLTPDGTAQAATGIAGNTFTARAAPGVAVVAATTTGTATVVLELCCSPFDCTQSAVWAPVGGGTLSLTTAAASAVSLLAPACLYRLNVTACATCGVRAAFACAGP
jgi:hypothetical protein